jgi:hypothetical protein
VKSGSVRDGRRAARAAALASRKLARLPSRSEAESEVEFERWRDDAARSPRVNDEDLLRWFG